MPFSSHYRRRPYVDEDYTRWSDGVRSRQGGKSALKVAKVDFLEDGNRKRHRTDEYENGGLIVRRGQEFDIEVNFDRTITSKDTIILQMTTGPKPQESKGSLIRVQVHPQNRTFNFRNCNIQSVVSDRKLKASVTLDARAAIGRYKLYVETTSDDDDGNKEEVDHDIIVLFNPWNEDDQVYMEGEDKLQEYVLRPSAYLWGANMTWNFDQFEDPCLDAALHVMDVTNLGALERANPIPVLRNMAALVNSYDDDGIVTGNWSSKKKDFADGTLPSAWTGSVAILKEYMATKKPVRYGQCWVFAAISTTLCRALGIPTRCITNFQSAHDTDGSLTIDNHFINGQPMNFIDDKIWLFHVWNESWLKRPDLPEGYDGWQVHDATPQEKSGGVYRCGPAPVKAIKEGHVWINYDTGFIFSELNGDLVNWEVTMRGAMTAKSVDEFRVGKRMSTLAVGTKRSRENVTDNYKYPDGSEKGREVVKSVTRFGSKGHLEIYDDVDAGDVKFFLSLPSYRTMVYEDFEVRVKTKNISDEPRTIRGQLSLYAASYTGITTTLITQIEANETIGPREKKNIAIQVKSEDFQRQMTPEGILMADTTFKVLETDRQWFCNNSVSFKKPDLEFKVPEKIKLGETIKGVVSFTNPLSIPMTDVEIRMEGGKAIRDTVYKHGKPLDPKQSLTHEFDIIPRKTGSREIVATLSSNELSGVDGSADFDVIE